MHILEYFSERKDMQVSLWSVSWQSTIKPCSASCFQTTCCVQMLAHGLWAFLCSTPLHNSSPTGMEAKERPLWLDETQIPAGPTKYLLGHTGHFYSQWLWETGGNQQNWALRVKCLFTQVHVCHFQKLQAQINKRKKCIATMWTSICLYHTFI